jgi:hypothetical protein
MRVTNQLDNSSKRTAARCCPEFATQDNYPISNHVLRKAIWIIKN